MSVWTRISEALAALRRGEGLVAVFDRLRGAEPASPERTVGFTIAVLALAAKMAKADGQVTVDEVWVARRVFSVPPEEEANAARVFNLARQDVAGFDLYARKVRAMFSEPQSPALVDLLEGLFQIAVADGDFHEAERIFLDEVARILEIEPAALLAIRARIVPPEACDPFEILGLPSGATIEEVRKAWKAAVRENHPDRLVARGVPEEAVKLAERRLQAVNRAWETIRTRNAA